MTLQNFKKQTLIKLIIKPLSNLLELKDEPLSIFEEKRKLIFYITMCLIGVPVFIAFGAYHIYDENYTEAITNLATAFYALITLIVVHYINNKKLIYKISIILMIIAVLTMQLSPGTYYEKTTWQLLLPLISFFLLGKKGGMLFTGMMLGLFLLFILTGNLLRILPEIQITSYHTRFFIIYFIISFLTFNFEAVRQHFQNSIDQLNNKLLAEHSQLIDAFEKVKSLSDTDYLTGCFNRTYLDRKFKEELSFAKKYKFSLSIILCDIDNFKKINDTYGHKMGDNILKHFVNIVGNQLRKKIDWLARYGGEEFFILLPYATFQSAMLIAERLRKAVELSSFLADEINFKITASFGVATFEGNNEINYNARHTTEDDIFKCADYFLYQAKNNGRNRVMGELFNIK
jgi:diguanylate cyclase (GGDEF)-like protein